MKHLTSMLALTALALPFAAHAQSQAESFSAACNKQNLNVGVKMVQDPFFRQFHNQDLVRSITQLRESAEADMAAGNLESCGIKAATISSMVKDPGHARVTLADYQSRIAATTGAAVISTQSVAPGHHFTQEQLIGTSLKSLNNHTLGTITGVIYSKTGEPLYVTLTPKSGNSANLAIPVGLLLVGENPHIMYVSLNSHEFWKETRFRDIPRIEPAG